MICELYKDLEQLLCGHSIATINPQFEPWGLINFMAQNHPGSSRERVEIETIIWMGNQSETGFNSRPGLYLRKYSILCNTKSP